MKIASLLLSCLAVAAAPVVAADAQVLLLGTYHFSNPGRDMNNVEAIDVLADDAQRQIEAIVASLGGFEPTRVFVEWPEAVVDERYADYLDGTLEPSANEVVQLGFRLAKSRGLKRVQGIDVDGDFPFEPIATWAAGNDKSAQLEASMATMSALTQRVEALQRDEGIAAALRFMNSESSLRDNQALHMNLLRYGSGDDQPGAALNTAWFDRNIRICARLLQNLADNDRAVVIFGSGHIPWLQRCLRDTPGVQVIATDRFLTRE